MLSEIDANKTLSEERRFQLRRGERLLPLEEGAKKADIEQSRAATSASNWQVRRGQELLQFEKDRITADINQSNAAAGAARTSQERISRLLPLEEKELQNKVNEYVTLEMNGQQFTAKGQQIINEINDRKKILRDEYDKIESRKREARKDAVSALKVSTEAETAITTGKLDGYSRTPEQLVPQADLYHSSSIKPYVYMYENEPGKVLGSNPVLKKRDLPKVDGHQYTAKEIYDAAEARGMTTQEYMEKVFYPMMQQPVPWVSAYPSTATK